MSLELENLVKNFEINSLSEELITLTAPFDWSSTSEVILKLQKRVDQLDITLKAKKYIAKIITESLDNVCRHVLKNIEYSDLSSFTCVLNDDKLYVATRNLIPNKIKNQLIEMIEDLNASSKEDLNDRFRKQLKFGKLDEEGNAGLGLLEIARKTNEKIKFNFEDRSEKSSFFTLFIIINTTQI